MRDIITQIRVLTEGAVALTEGAETIAVPAKEPRSFETLIGLCESVQEDYGVYMSVVENQGDLMLTALERETGLPGAGRLAAKRLCEHADSTGQTTYLAMGRNDKLIDFYQGLGFEIEDEGNGGVNMKREPKTV